MSPTIVESLMARAFAAHQAHKFVDAIALYEVVLAREAENVDALNLCASAYRSNGDVRRAVTLYTKAMKLAPQRADILLNAGNALAAAGQLAEALAAYAEARRLDPDNAEIHANIGVALGRQGDFPRAVEAYRAALALKPDHRVAGHNLGNALAEIGDFKGAATTLRRLAEADPTFTEARYNLSLNLLRQGDYTAGFILYEQRWQTPGFPSPLRHADKPVWDGRPFEGRTLLLHAEQGLGDTLQFVRFVALAKSLGGEVVVQLPRVLTRLCQGLDGADRIVAEDRDIGPVDCQCPLMSLPHRLKLTLGSVGMGKPYLAGEPALAERWRHRLGLDGSRPAVGFVWRGNPKSPAPAISRRSPPSTASA
jgi:Tfp pilus assembly protein PilF